MRRSLIATTATVAAFAATVAPALAHVDVTSTSPSRGGSAKTTIRTVKVTFDGQLRSGTADRDRRRQRQGLARRRRP